MDVPFFVTHGNRLLLPPDNGLLRPTPSAKTSQPTTTKTAGSVVTEKETESSELALNTFGYWVPGRDVNNT